MIVPRTGYDLNSISLFIEHVTSTMIKEQLLVFPFGLTNNVQRICCKYAQILKLGHL